MSTAQPALSTAGTAKRDLCADYPIASWRSHPSKPGIIIRFATPIRGGSARLVTSPALGAGCSLYFPALTYASSGAGRSRMIPTILKLPNSHVILSIDQRKRNPVYDESLQLEGEILLQICCRCSNTRSCTQLCIVAQAVSASRPGIVSVADIAASPRLSYIPSTVLLTVSPYEIG